MGTRVRCGCVALAGVFVFAAVGAAQQVVRVSLGDGSVEGNGGADAAALSADGRIVAFGSGASNLVAGDTNGVEDVFVRDRATGAIERVSVASDGTQADGASYRPSLSADGRWVAFESDADNLVPGDTNSHTDVYVRDRVTGVTVRGSVGQGAESNGVSQFARLSADGVHLAFVSSASNLVAGDTNAKSDVFVRDLVAGTNVRASVSSTGKQANGDSERPALASGGNVVAFYSAATNLVGGDTNLRFDAFVHDLTAGTTTRVSVAGDGTQGNDDSFEEMISLSGDGNLVAFGSLATNLVPGDVNRSADIFVHDVAAATTELASVATGGAQGDQESQRPVISDDGTRVLFLSASRVFDARKTTSLPSAFLRDRVAATTVLASMGCSQVEADAAVFAPALSADGETAVFLTAATNLSSNDTNGVADDYAADFSLTPAPAARSSYGVGWPGTLGTPALTASANPALGSAFDLSVDNSRPIYAVGFELIGVAPLDQPTRYDGRLLVAPLAILVQALAPGTTDFPVTVPADDAICNVAVYLQVIILDPGASAGFSFTPGLELDVGI
jgi:Tol biopolymer transport system component